MILLPSIASADQMQLKNEIDRLGDWPYLHIDVEDGNFLPNITFGMKTISGIAAAAKDKILDAHLLVTNPMDYLEPMAALGVKKICAHIEPMLYPLEFLNKARDLGMQAGLALNFATPLCVLEPFWPAMDFCLFMTAEPDSRGNQLYGPALDRAIAAARQHGKDTDIYVDGGLNPDALTRLREAGAAAAVLGRLCWGAEDPKARLAELSSADNI
ncbi:MAG: ribulose-phosphate 3-epimerase [Christensenellaceae bacterium]|nr:ribulose-phosphate 3-epimerase [Christensenellaceae bacterium]